MMAVPRLDEAEHDRLVRAALLAPAIHRTHPWRFRFHGPTIEVLRDPELEVPGGDPTPNGVLISIGAAIFNLRTAAAYLGYGTSVRLLPDTDQPLEAAAVDLTTAAPGELGALAALYGQLVEPLHRESGPPRLTVPIRADLSTAAVQEGATLEWISDPIRLGRLGPGLAGPGGVGPGQVGSGGVGPGRPRPPSIAVLSTAHDLPTDQLAAGFALQRIRLTAARHGLAVSPPEHRMDRHKLRGLVRDPRRGWIEPHIVIRFAATRPRELALRELDEYLLEGAPVGS